MKEAGQVVEMTPEEEKYTQQYAHWQTEQEKALKEIQKGRLEEREIFVLAKRTQNSKARVI